jgi:hypothetical protein
MFPDAMLRASNSAVFMGLISPKDRCSPGALRTMPSSSIGAAIGAATDCSRQVLQPLTMCITWGSPAGPGRGERGSRSALQEEGREAIFVSLFHRRPAALRRAGRYSRFEWQRLRSCRAGPRRITLTWRNGEWTRLLLLQLGPSRPQSAGRRRRASTGADQTRAARKPISNHRLLGPLQDAHDLPLLTSPPDTLRDGLVTLKDGASSSHPVETIQAQGKAEQAQKLQMLRNLYGPGLPARMQIESQILDRWGSAARRPSPPRAAAAAGPCAPTADRPTDQPLRGPAGASACLGYPPRAWVWTRCRVAWTSSLWSPTWRCRASRRSRSPTCTLLWRPSST